VLAAGVCHSDWHLVTGATPHPLPAVLGHEGCGEVVSVGEGVDDLAPGDRVILNWAPACGTCFYCERGKPNLCETYHDRIWAGTLLDGTSRFHQAGNPLYQYCGLACFSTHTVVPRVSAVKVPQVLDANVGALIGCAVTTGVGSVLNTAQVQKGRSVAVFGVGGVGLSTVMGAKLAGAEPIIAIDLHPTRLEAALQLGATHMVISSENTDQDIKDLTGGRGVDYAFEAAGIPSLQAISLRSLTKGGKLILSGIAPKTATLPISPAELTRSEQTVAGSYYGSSAPQVDFNGLATAFLDGRLPIDRLISRTYRLDEINEAYADMLAGTIQRGVVVFA